MRLTALKTRIFWNYWGWEGSIQNESGLKRTYFAPAGRLRRKSVILSDIQKVEAN